MTTSATTKKNPDTIYEMCARCRNRIVSFDNGVNWWHDREPTNEECWEKGPVLREGPPTLSHWKFTQQDGKVLAEIGVGFDNVLRFTFPHDCALHMLADAMTAAKDAETWSEQERENFTQVCVNCDSELDGMDAIRYRDERTGEFA